MFDRDEFETADGMLALTPIHHASLILQWDGKTIYCDPVGGEPRYHLLDKPDLIVLTHAHGDHFDIETIDALVGDDTQIVAPVVCAEQLPEDLRARTHVMANGQTWNFAGIAMTATPMYNTTPERAKFHEKGVGNGYLFDFSGTTLYLASDTEPVAEMDDLGPVDIALFPMNLPYTMTPDQVVTCIEKTGAKVVYPFHYRYPFDQIGTEPDSLIALLQGREDVDVRARNWYLEV